MREDWKLAVAAVLPVLIIVGVAACSEASDKVLSRKWGGNINQFEICMAKELSGTELRQTFRQVAPDNSFFVATYGSDQNAELVRVTRDYRQLDSERRDVLKRADDSLQARAAENSVKECTPAFHGST